jgi:thiamine pyrophosphate-dependent acetolactate synthase large subunit-like protein
MWAAQYFGFEKPNRWMTSGGLGTMGYGLPAAMGVQIAHPDALVIDIAGEASILMNIQEMSTIAQYRLPVKVFILNNEYMGMVRQWQELLHGNRYSESYIGRAARLREARGGFGCVGLRCSKPSELDDVIKEMIAERASGDRRHRGRREGELLPDDPLGRRAQRDAARPQRQGRARQADLGRGHGARLTARARRRS